MVLGARESCSADGSGGQETEGGRQPDDVHNIEIIIWAIIVAPILSIDHFFSPPAVVRSASRFGAMKLEQIEATTAPRLHILIIAN